MPIGISPEPPPDVPGSFVFSDHFETWYTDHVLAPGLVKRSDVRRWLNAIWRNQKKLAAVTRTIP